MRLIRRNSNSGYKGMAKIARQANANIHKMQQEIAASETKPEIDKTINMTNPFIGDSYFTQNPSKVLGEQTTKRGRFDDEMIVVKGTIEDLDKIDATPIAVKDITQKPIQSTINQELIIEQVFENEFKRVKADRINKVRKIKTEKKPAAQSSAEQEIYTFKEIHEMYNRDISRDELEAYYFTNPDLNYKNLIDEFTNSKQDLIDKGLICFDKNKWVYLYTYQSGNVPKKISELKRDRDRFIEQHGEPQYNKQLAFLEAVRPPSKGFVGDERIILLPHSAFAKNFKIERLRFGIPEFYREMSITDAFAAWLRVQPADMFKKTTSFEIIEYYVENKPIKIDKSMPKEWQIKEEKKAINVRQRTKEEGDELFAKFLADELDPQDQAKLAYLWNEKYNSIAEVNLSKIPVCFRISKTFKANAPFYLNATQRQGVASAQEKRSVGLAYGVGVGKTASAIACFSQAYYNNFSKKGVFVVPTNTYYKWISEIKGGMNKEKGVYMHGLLPQINVVGLFNLNPVIVKDELKVYTAKEEAMFTAIQEAIDYVKGIDGDKVSEDQEKAISRIYNLPFNGIRRQWVAENDAKLQSNARQKSFKDFLLQYLRDEYNYYVYANGKIKSFPEGTAFVITEVGLQRLGVSEYNRERLVGRLYQILSQGEMSATKESKRDIAALQIKIEKTVSSSLKNAKLNIEDLEIDWASFDEAHLYKKLFVYVKGQIVGEKEDYKTGETKVVREKAKYELKSGATPSQRALSAFVLSHYIQSTYNNRNIVLLTATPFTNSPLEVFSMLTFTNYALLEEYGLDNMVDFFDTFMKINWAIKYTPQKTVVKGVVLTGYNNLTQLRQFIYTLWDKRDEGASLIRPKKIMFPSKQHSIETTIPMTEEQNRLMADVKKYMTDPKASYLDLCGGEFSSQEEQDFEILDDESLVAEWERITGREFEGERDNLSDSRRSRMISEMKNSKEEGTTFSEEDLDEEESLGVRILRGLSMMRQITLSPYLYYKACKKATGETPMLPNYKDYVESSPKLMYVMGCIKSEIDYHRSKDERQSGKVIYMNAGVEYFVLIKEYLVREIGLKEQEVGIVNGQMSKTAVESVKQKFLKGDILILIGSSTISVGVDLQDNSTSLFNLYYDWNPTDAAQIEGRIWRQGNRFANVRIVYPQCYNSADPVIFEYLNQKTLRINEIWNRSGTEQELDLRDFDPKTLQKQLITDPEEKADWEILEEKEKLEGQIIYNENRRESLQKALGAINNVKILRPNVIQLLNELHNKRLEAKRANQIKAQNDKIARIVEEFKDNPEKMQKAINKYNEEKYDHQGDPEGRYTPMDYTTATDEQIYTDAYKWIQTIGDWQGSAADIYGNLYYSKNRIVDSFYDYRGNYSTMESARIRILEPMGLDINNLADPMASFENRLKELKDQADMIDASREGRIEKYKAEALQNAHLIKTVNDRIAEYASYNSQLLSAQLHYPKADEVETAPPVIPALDGIQQVVSVPTTAPYLTDPNAIIAAMLEIAAKSKNKEAFLKNVRSIAENYMVEIDSDAFYEAMQLKRGDKKHNEKVLSDFYNNKGLPEKKARKEEMKKVKEEHEQQVAEQAVETIVETAKATEAAVEEQIKKDVDIQTLVEEYNQWHGKKDKFYGNEMNVKEFLENNHEDHLHQLPDLLNALNQTPNSQVISKSDIQEQIKALALAKKFVSKAEAKEIDEQINALKISLKYL